MPVGACKLHNVGNTQSLLGKQLQGESPVVLEAVAKGTPADHVEALSAQVVLQCAEPDSFEQDQAFRAILLQPGKLFSPIICALEKPSHCPCRKGLTYADPDIMPFRRQPQVERSKVTGFSDAEDTHGRVLADGT